MLTSAHAGRSNGVLAPVKMCLAAVLLSLAPTPVSADVVLAPWGGNIAFFGTQAKAGPVEDIDSQSVPGAAQWSSTLTSVAYDPASGAFGSSSMILQTSFSNSAFDCASSAVGTTNASGGTTRCGSLAFVYFAVERTQSLESIAQLALGTLGSSRSLAFVANFMNKDLAMVNLVTGEGTTNVSTRLSPGVYAFYYQNDYRDESADGTSNQLSAHVGFADVPNPLIQQHPQSQSAPAGGPAAFSVGASGVATRDPGVLTLSYQWRHDYQPLSDGGRISGAHTAQLHLTGVVAADSGIYDCVVTQGTITEPSSAAKLTVTGVVGAPAPLAASGLELGAPSPSPFRSSTRVRFTLAREARVTLDVIDLAGRRVRTLLHDEPHAAGARTVEWDGRDGSGDALRSGLYFVRLRAGSEQCVRRVVRAAP